MSNLHRFWQGVESLPGLAAVGAEWQAILGMDFRLAKPFLRARRERAESYPRFDGGLPYEIIHRGDDEFVGVCRESGDTITLAKSQLVVYELDRRLLADRVARALGIERSRPIEDWDGTVLHIGNYVSAAGTRYLCILAFPQESTDIHVISSRLIADKHAPFILLAPTRRWVRRAAETTMKLHGSVLVPLVEAITAVQPGQLQVAKPLESFVACAADIVKVPAVVAQAGDGSNVFRLEGNVWTVTFHDRTVRLKDGLGLKYIAHLIGFKRREVDVAVLKAAAVGGQAAKPYSGVEMLDGSGIREGEAKCRELVEELDEAKEFNDLARQEQIQGHISSLAEQLKVAKGFGGRKRKVGDESTSIRTSVKNAIDRLLEVLRKMHLGLAHHLDNSIRTGSTLCYDPHPDIDWET